MAKRLRRAPGAGKRATVAAELMDRTLPGVEQTFLATLAANFTANIIRNVWAHAIIFCGHFPDQTYTFSKEETANETRGGWYVRQLLGSANIEGSPLFHVISGNLGYQVEHHLYPDMPSTRYSEVAPKVKDICERYELPYNSGPFGQSMGTGAPDDLPPRISRRPVATQARALPPGPAQCRRTRKGPARPHDSGTGYPRDTPTPAPNTSPAVSRSPHRPATDQARLVVAPGRSPLELTGHPVLELLGGGGR